MLTSAFTPPLTYTRIDSAGLYDNAGLCESWHAAFCYEHWHVSDTGGGWCPQGHFKSLDPHLSPAD